MKKKAGTILILLCLFFMTVEAGIKYRQIRAVLAEGPIKIDGILEESVWQSEGYSGFIQSDPDDGSPASEKTVIWIAYDKKNLYIAARLYDSHPDRIITRLGRRDDHVDSDWFTFAVDPYFDKRSGFQFAVNPAGSIIDSTLYNDEGKDETWDGIWESGVNIGSQGWTVEIRIPFQQLRFKQKESYIWGINCFREIKRKNEITAFAWVPKEESGYVSRFAVLTGIESIDPGRLIEFLPYTMGKAVFNPEEKNNLFHTGQDYQSNLGFDFISGLQSNLTFNLAVNPDFGQVEVDPAVINISDQETYYVEKRPFFIEGADIFRFGTGGANTVRNLGWTSPSFFYSRRIGRSPQGSFCGEGFVDHPDWTTILAAAKITGKIGRGWNIGFLNALTEREYASVDSSGEQSRSEIEPFSYYGILRVQKEFHDGRQGMGMILTSVLRDLNSEALNNSLTRNALSLAIDGWTFLDRERTWVVTGWFGGTRVTGSRESMMRLQTSSLHYFQRPDVNYVRVDENATSLSGWAGRIYLNKQKDNLVFNMGLGAISPGFNAMDMGYHSRGDIINAHIETGYQAFHPGKILRQWKLTSAIYHSYDFGGNRNHEYYIFTATGQFLNYWQGMFYWSYDPNRYNHYLTRGGPMSFYPWGIMRKIQISSDNRKHFVLTLAGHYRTHPTGSYNYSGDVSLRWKPAANFSLSLGLGYSWRHSIGQYITNVKDDLKTETFGVRYIMSDIIQETLPLEIRINWTFTPRLSLQVYLQPFIGIGDYYKFKELTAARTFDFDVFGEGDSTIILENNIYTVDPDGPGPAKPFLFKDPDFNLKSLRGTIVLRWEYKPGSTIYAVWTQSRADHSFPGVFQLGRDLQTLFNAAGENIFLLKINYRFKL
jgi:hypothetical protein